MAEFAFLEYELSHDLQDVSDALKITSVNGHIEFAAHIAMHIVDRLREQCYGMVGPESTVNSLMAGEFDSTEEFDSNLATIAQSMRNLSSERGRQLARCRS